MTQKLEINLLPTTAGAARTFLADLDRQIEELDNALTIAKQVRGTVARAFGVDRREGGSPMQKLLDAGTRSTTEIEVDQAALEKELSIPEGTTLVVVDHLAEKLRSAK